MHMHFTVVNLVDTICTLGGLCIPYLKFSYNLKLYFFINFTIHCDELQRYVNNCECIYFKKTCIAVTLLPKHKCCNVCKLYIGVLYIRNFILETTLPIFDYLKFD